MEQKNILPMDIYIAALCLGVLLTYRDTELKDTLLMPVACWDFLIQKPDFYIFF